MSTSNPTTPVRQPSSAQALVFTLTSLLQRALALLPEQAASPEHQQLRDEFATLQGQLADDPLDIPIDTPAAMWALLNQPDPHQGHYECSRKELTLGNFTDDELANAAFMNYDQFPNIQDVLAGKAHMPIVYMTAVKDRIRWLSRSLATTQALYTHELQLRKHAELTGDSLARALASEPSGTAQDVRNSVALRLLAAALTVPPTALPETVDVLTYTTDRYRDLTAFVEYWAQQQALHGRDDHPDTLPLGEWYEQELAFNSTMPAPKVVN